MDKRAFVKAMTNFFSRNEIFAEMWNKLGPGSEHDIQLDPAKLSDFDENGIKLKYFAPNDGCVHIYKMYNGRLLHVVIPPVD